MSLLRGVSARPGLQSVRAGCLPTGIVGLVNLTSNQYLADPLRHVVPIHEARSACSKVAKCPEGSGSPL